MRYVDLLVPPISLLPDHTWRRIAEVVIILRGQTLTTEQVVAYIGSDDMALIAPYFTVVDGVWSKIKQDSSAERTRRYRERRAAKPKQEPQIPQEVQQRKELPWLEHRIMELWRRKRPLNQTQKQIVAEIAEKHEREKIEEWLAWANARDIPLGTALSSAKATLDKWGRQKKGKNGTTQFEFGPDIGYSQEVIDNDKYLKMLEE